MKDLPEILFLLSICCIVGGLVLTVLGRRSVVLITYFCIGIVLWAMGLFTASMMENKDGQCDETKRIAIWAQWNKDVDAAIKATHLVPMPDFDKYRIALLVAERTRILTLDSCGCPIQERK